MKIRSGLLMAALLISSGVLLQRHFSSTAPERIPSRNFTKNAVLFDVTSAFANNKGEKISSHITGNGRALAVKIYSGTMADFDLDRINKYGCIIFTTQKPHCEVLKEEIEFINDIIGIKDNEMAMIGIGDPKNIEASFQEFVTAQRVQLP